MRILVTGAAGLVGGGLATVLTRAGHTVVGTVREHEAAEGIDSRRVDLAEPGALAAVIASDDLDVVVHAAYSTRDLERDVVSATHEVAATCAGRGIAMVHLSTDAVFDGEAAPYAEGDQPAPIHPYGDAKRRAEIEVELLVPDATVVRLGLVAHLEATTDLPRLDAATRWLATACAARQPVILFTDEVRAVIRLDDLVATLARLVEVERAERGGCWHLAGPEPMSRAQLGRLVIERLGLDDSAVRFDTAATHGEPRPRDVSMTCRRAVERLSFAPRPVDTVTAHGSA
ncbi:MAG TPA: sugar nucleotide-binding protein [Microthrixaceae bacterium]|nr:sugar nucleotide-binding protein [Microthrixaceae bacterium]